MFKRLPFRIAKAPDLFQREMLRILEGTQGQVYHMDDLLVFGKDKLEHGKRLKEMLGRLVHADVTLNAVKCEVAYSRIKFWGYVIDWNGLSADP